MSQRLTRLTGQQQQPSAAEQPAGQQQGEKPTGQQQQGEQPAGQQQQQRQRGQPREDCTTCRVVGAGVCLGTSGYLLLQMRAHPPTSPQHRLAYLSLVLGLGSIGLYRAVV